MTAVRPFGDPRSDVVASWPAWTALVASCAVTLVVGIEADPSLATASILALVMGALVGRLLHLEGAFARTPAWMWAVGASAFGLLLGRAGLTPEVASAAGLFLLPLDWRSAPRARAAVAAGFVLLILSSRGTGDLSLGGAAVWGATAAVGLVLLERDQRRDHARRLEDGPATGPVAWPRQSWRDGVAIGAVVVVAVLLALVLLPPPTPTPSSGRPGSGGQGDDTYWGFGNQLDTAVRGERGEDVVLRVRADRAGLWRGDSFDAFDGRVWMKSLGRARPLAGLDTFLVPTDAFSDQRGIDTVDETQVFTFETGGNDLVFGAGRPASVATTASSVSWAAGAGTLRLGEPLGRGGSYSVVSARARVSEDVLRGADPRALVAATDLSAPDRARLAAYLSVPESTTERTRELARSVTAGQASVFEKIQALQAWLGANTTYTLDVPPLPDGRDAVDQYLFVDQQGFCEQIASALTVMLRSLGVPARLAVGFVPDHQDTATGEWIVKEKDAHAWVEVWWPGLGWQGFDPTASVPLAPEAAASPASRAGDLWLVIAGALGVVALAVLATWLVPRLADRRARRSAPWVDRAVARLDRAGAIAGRPRAPAETLLEYGEALEGTPVRGHGAGAVAASLSAEVFGGPGDRAGAATAVLDREATEALLADLEGVARRHRRAARRHRGRAPGNRSNSPGGNDGDTAARGDTG